MNKDRLMASIGATIGVLGLAGGIYIATKDKSQESPMDPINNLKNNPNVLAAETTPQSQYKENNNWDASNSLPKGQNLNQLSDWYKNMQSLANSGSITKGDVRTFDALDELLKDGKGTIYAKENGDFPKADELLIEASNIGTSILSKLNFTNINDNDAEALGMKIIRNSFLVTNDGKTVFARNLFPDAINGIKRENQKEDRICSVYETSTKIGDEVVRGGILHESDEASFILVYAIGDKAIVTSDQSSVHTMLVNDAGNQRKILSWRWVDAGSEPNQKANLTPPSNFTQYVWGSIILNPCGPIAAPTKVMIQSGVAPIPVQPSQPQPPNTEVPPPQQSQQKGPDPFNNGQNNGSDMTNRTDRGTGGGANNTDPGVNPNSLNQTGSNEP